MKNQDKNNQIIIYNTDDGRVRVEVLMKNETVWLTQKQMAELFDCSVDNIGLHLKNVYLEQELDEKRTSEDSSVVQKEGDRQVKRKVKAYNLDVIISVGYRINSLRGTQFRIWATQKLKEYIIKGFAMDDERLKEAGGGNYWKELLDRIRDIRSSEKVLYRQVLDLYATSVDYNPHSQETQEFFSIVQNKLHYAANGKTAAELISERADADKPFMGLMTFGKNGIRKQDVVIAKNYLDEKELKRLNNVVSAYFDIAELRALDGVKTTMKDYLEQLDRLVMSMDRKVLRDAGRISKIEAEKRAFAEYGKFQAKSISPVEEDYLKNIKLLEKKLSKKNKS